MVLQGLVRLQCRHSVRRMSCTRTAHALDIVQLYALRCLQEAELALAEHEADQVTLKQLHEQLRDAKHKLHEMLQAYHRAQTDRTDSAGRARAAAAQLAQHKLVVAHLQKHLERTRNENERLRVELQTGSRPQVQLPMHLEVLRDDASPCDC